MVIADKYKDLLSKPIDSIDYWAEGAVLDFTEDLARVMHENDISRAELAKRVGTSASYITKVFGGNANFTIETMTKLALAVDRLIRIHVAPKDCRTIWRDVYTNIYVQTSGVTKADTVTAIGGTPNHGATSGFKWQAKAASYG